MPDNSLRKPGELSEEPSDADLLTRTRGGDEQAYDLLYRRHSQSALRFARSMTGSPADAEDVVAEAFVRVLAALRAGNGPEEALRPYLLSVVRHVCYDNARRNGRELAVEDLSSYDPGQPFSDPVTEGEERALIAQAFDKLPQRWRMVLWHTEVEGENAAAVAPLLGISPNAVAALAYRAREGLRESYLQVHLASITDDACRRTVDKLAAYTRGNLSEAEQEKVRAHLDSCENCRVLFLELADVNARLGALLGPVVLGAAAASFAAGGATVASVGGTASAVGAAAAGSTGTNSAVTGIGMPGAGGAAGTGAGTSGVGTVGGAQPAASAPSRAIEALQRIARQRVAQVGVGAVGVAAAVALVVGLLNQPSDPGQPPPDPKPAAAQPMVSTVDSTAPVASPSPSPSPSTSNTRKPPASTPPLAPPAAPINLGALVQPVGSLVRGRAGVLALGLDNATSSESGALTATFTVPSGVTLNGASAGDGWTCGESGPIVCQRDSLPPGTSTQAYVKVSVSSGAASGNPSVQISGPGITTINATAARGVQGEGLAAALAVNRPATVVTAGNALLSCQAAQSHCSQARDGMGGSLDNNDWNMAVYGDPGAPAGGGLPAGAAVSGASLTISGTVIWAGLYWAGTGNAPATPTAYVRPPGASSYTALAAARVDALTLGGIGPAYQVRADATALATGAGAGTWWVGVPGNAFTTGTNHFGGWSLMVIVDNGGPVRTVAVFDGGVVLDNGESFSSTVYGQPGGAATVGFIGWEGDRGSSGDKISLAGPLGGPDANNIASSRTAGTAAGWNTFGTDARVLTGTLGSEADPMVSASTTGDVWVIGALAVIADRP